MHMAGDRGFEPRLADPESAVLPLDESPIRCDYSTRQIGEQAVLCLEGLLSPGKVPDCHREPIADASRRADICCPRETSRTLNHQLLLRSVLSTVRVNSDKNVTDGIVPPVTFLAEGTLPPR